MRLGFPLLLSGVFAFAAVPRRFSVLMTDTLTGAATLQAQNKAERTGNMSQINEFFSMHPEIIYVLRIILAGICGGIIGFERTLRQKDAGFRTHIIVAVGAAIQIIVSKYGFYDALINEAVKVDVSRVAASIITGFSFLGAGMIFVKGANIKGLTTAAGILVTAAVGMAIGAGMYTVGIASVALLLLVQVVFHKFLIGFDKGLVNDTMIPCFIQIENEPNAINKMKKFFEERDVHIADSSVETAEENSLLTIHLKVMLGKNVDVDEVMAQLLAQPSVKQAFAL